MAGSPTIAHILLDSLRERLRADRGCTAIELATRAAVEPGREARAWALVALAARLRSDGSRELARIRCGAREVFSFHRPETLAGWIAQIHEDPTAPTLAPPPARAAAARHQRSLVQPRSPRSGTSRSRSPPTGPRALIQMATGSGKTFTAANITYRLVKHANARHVLFLVDRANLGRQTLKEFQGFSTPGDGRKFTDLYNVQHLSLEPRRHRGAGDDLDDPAGPLDRCAARRTWIEELDEHSSYEARLGGGPRGDTTRRFRPSSSTS